MGNKSPERGDLPKATQPVISPTMFYLFSLEEKVESFRDYLLLLTGDQSSSFLSRNRDAAGSPGAIYVSKLQPGKLAAEGRRLGSVTTVPVLFRLLLITLVAALAHGFVLSDFCFHYSFIDLGSDMEGLCGTRMINS